MSLPSRAFATSRLLAGIVLIAAFATPTRALELPDEATQRRWIEEMKASKRGPFARIRWFCADGSVLPPKPGACTPHGGGIQHGEWSDRTVALREAGHLVGNVLAELEPGDFVGGDAKLDLLKQILLERFLILWDDGWIFRGARSYRGALQAEDEEAQAREVVLAILGDPLWRAPARFALAREAVRLLPVRADRGLATEVRVRALEIADADPGFMPLRAKIHGTPDPGDAASVRAYASERGLPALAEDYRALAEQIDALYDQDAAASVRSLSDRVSDTPLSAALREGADALDGTPAPDQRLPLLSELLALIRDRFPRIADPGVALSALEASLAIEDEVYAAGNQLAGRVPGYSRRQRLRLLEHGSRALYGAGFLSSRHVDGLRQAFTRMEEAKPLTVDAYADELGYLARVPEWSNRWLGFHFSEAEARLAKLEPEVHLYSQDRLRGSPVLFYSTILDTLLADAGRQAGVRHTLFGQSVGVGLRALNPGLAEGPLRLEGGEHGELRSDGIYLLPETTSELPRVAGILTEGEGSSLSHVQLLARNLGIPNVVVGKPLLDRVRARSGRRVVMAVSPGGVVELADYGPRWKAVFEDPGMVEGVVIRPDLEKLDLESTTMVPLSGLRAADSGCVSGPKGANLGELTFVFGERVPGGFVIPFGAFRRLLDGPLEPGGPQVFEWMRGEYAAIERIRDPERRAGRVSSFLARLRAWIEDAPLSPSFLAELRAMFEQTVGPGDAYGVFVRSDTNVEDLPGFTGAGLNLTVANVRGFDALVSAVRRVWASPFTERAYGWRQQNMEQPEYVFPAVVVQRAMPSEKSGVMVTTDVAGGGMDFVSVAVNEGVGGAVDGQASESLRIDLGSGEARFLAQATAPTRAVLLPGGGVTRLPSSGTDAVLAPGEIEQLASLARSLPTRFPSIRTEEGEPAPADIEFAFFRGELVLLQIRPFVESDRARSAAYLQRLDAGLRERGGRWVELGGVPEVAEPAPSAAAAVSEGDR